MSYIISKDEMDSLTNDEREFCEQNVLQIELPLKQSLEDTPPEGTSSESLSYECGDGYCAQSTEHAARHLCSVDKQPYQYKPSDYSDAGNAALLVDHYGADIKFTDALGWMCWHSNRWEPNDHKPTAYAIELTDHMLAEALSKYTEEKEAAEKLPKDASKEEKSKVQAQIKSAQKYYNHAHYSRSKSKITAMVELAKPYLVMKAADFDADPFILNMPGGIVDLRTGKIRSHTKEAYCSKITTYSPGNNGADIWDAFLDNITTGNMEKKAYLQEIAGMSAIGAVFNEGVCIAYGVGKNGKSTLFNALARALGDYAGTIDIDVLTTDRNNKGASMATLRGKRLVIAGELEEGKRLSVSMIKRIASTDMITVEEKYRQPETIVPTHTLIMFTNHLPRVGSTDNGTWRRLSVIPFTKQITLEEDVKKYDDVLLENAAPAIFTWIIEGAIRFINNGYNLHVPDDVRLETDKYRSREDWLSNFIDDKCIKGPSLRVRAKELYDSYKSWTESTGDYARRTNEFKSAMETAGFKNVKPQNKSTWLGICIDPDSTGSGVPNFSQG